MTPENMQVQISLTQITMQYWHHFPATIRQPQPRADPVISDHIELVSTNVRGMLAVKLALHLFAASQFM